MRLKPARRFSLGDMLPARMSSASLAELVGSSLHSLAFFGALSSLLDIGGKSVVPSRFSTVAWCKAGTGKNHLGKPGGGGPGGGGGKQNIEGDHVVPGNSWFAWSTARPQSNHGGGGPGG